MIKSRLFKIIFCFVFIFFNNFAMDRSIEFDFSHSSRLVHSIILVFGRPKLPRSFPSVYNPCIDSPGFGWLWIYFNDLEGDRGGLRKDLFKIHLQVKKKYFIDFMTDLSKALKKASLLLVYKLTLFFVDFNHIENRVPLSVFYLPYMGEEYVRDEKLRYDFLNKYVSFFVEFSKKWCKNKKLTLENVAFDIKPLFNREMNPIVHIAGGNRNDKLDYLKKRVADDSWKFTEEGASIFTEDGAFFRGFEYY